MADRWGDVDRSLNPDLDDIATSYADATVLVAWLDMRIVGVGALVPVDTSVAEVKRMSVARELRRHGIGRAILDRLCTRPVELGHRQVVLSTTRDWHDAVAFYLNYGCQITHHTDSRFGAGTHFSIDLSRPTNQPPTP